MSVIDRDRWRELEPLLDRALDLPDAERAALLGELRSTSPELAADLAALLDGEVTAGRQGFLDAAVGAAALLAALGSAAAPRTSPTAPRAADGTASRVREGDAV